MNLRHFSINSKNQNSGIFGSRCHMNNQKQTFYIIQSNVVHHNWVHMLLVVLNCLVISSTGSAPTVLHNQPLLRLLLCLTWIYLTNIIHTPYCQPCILFLVKSTKETWRIALIKTESRCTWIEVIQVMTNYGVQHWGCLSHSICFQINMKL